MMRALLRIGFVAMLLVASAARADACTAVSIGLPRPEPDLVALSGIVMGYVDMPGTAGAPVRALLVSTDVGVNGPPESMHWRPLHVAPDCSSEGWSNQELAEQYPVGVCEERIDAILAWAGVTGKARRQLRHQLELFRQAR